MNVSSVITGSFIEQFSKSSSSSSSLSSSSSEDAVDYSSVLQNGASVYSNAIQTLSSAAGYVNLAIDTLTKLGDITDRLITASKKVCHATGQNTLRKANREFQKLALEFNDLIENAKFNEREYLTKEGLETLFKDVGLDANDARELASLFDTFILAKQDTNETLASDMIKSANTTKIPKSAFKTTVNRAYIEEKYQTSNHTTHIIDAVNSLSTINTNTVSEVSQERTTDSLTTYTNHTISTVQGLQTATNAIVEQYDETMKSSFITLTDKSTTSSDTCGKETIMAGNHILNALKASTLDGYSVIESKKDLVEGSNSDGFNQLFLVDNLGNVSQITNFTEDVTFGDIDISENSHSVFYQYTANAVEYLGLDGTTYATSTGEHFSNVQINAVGDNVAYCVEQTVDSNTTYDVFIKTSTGADIYLEDPGVASSFPVSLNNNQVIGLGFIDSNTVAIAYGEEGSQKIVSSDDTTVILYDGIATTPTSDEDETSTTTSFTIKNFTTYEHLGTNNAHEGFISFTSANSDGEISAYTMRGEVTTTDTITSFKIDDEEKLNHLKLNSDGCCQVISADHLFTANQNGYSVIESCADLTGNNANGYKQLFLMDASGNAIQQLTSFNKYVSFSDVAISNESNSTTYNVCYSYTDLDADNKTILNSTGSETEISADAPLEGLKLNNSGTALIYKTALAAPTEGDPDAIKEAIFYKDLTTSDPAVSTSAYKSISGYGFIENNKIALAYVDDSDQSFIATFNGTETTNITGTNENEITNSVNIQQFSTLEKTENYDGYIAFTSGATENKNDLTILKTDGTIFQSKDLAETDQIKTINMLFDSSTNTAPSVGLFGVLNSSETEYDVDSEMYELTYSGGPKEIIYSSSVSDPLKLFNSNFKLSNRASGYVALNDLNALKKQIDNNLKTLNDSLNYLQKNVDLARATGYAFLNTSYEVEDYDTAETLEKKLDKKSAKQLPTYLT